MRFFTQKLMIVFFGSFLHLHALTTLTVNTMGDSNIGAGGTFGGSSGDLRGVLNYLNQSAPVDTYDIVFALGTNNTINLGAMLPLINLTQTYTINIDGANGADPQIILDGVNTYRGFYVRQGTVSFQNMTIQNVFAQGGTGGGGGMGAGAALFVDTANSVTLTNVTISNANVMGGSGGGGYAPSLSPTGGGGLGGDGAINGGGGGIGGVGGAGSSTSAPYVGGGGGGINCGASHTGTGGAGSAASVFPGLAGGGVGGASGGQGSSGASSPSGGLGGASGGGGGGGTRNGGAGFQTGNGGGGGVGGGGTSGTSNFGGMGGYGGGGGAGGNANTSNLGGQGGPGGGGGTGGTSGGSGGFGGGGGCGSSSGGGSAFGGGGGCSATGPIRIGGVGGGQGTSNLQPGGSGSGGGAGFGGAIFVRSGSVTINSSSTSIGANSASPGTPTPATGAVGGWSAGNDFFFLTGVTPITIDPEGGIFAVSNSIADDSPASFDLSPMGVTKGTGAGARITVGTTLGGRLTFSAANTYSGGTVINSGTLSLSGNGALYTAGSVTTNNPGIEGIFDIGLITNPSTTIGDLIGVAGSFVKLGPKRLIFGTTNSTTYAGSIQDGGLDPSLLGALTKEGTGIFTATGANTYTGGTNINTGIFLAGNNGALGGSSVAGTIVASGASLQLANGINIPMSQPLQIAGVGMGGIGALSLTSSAIASYAGPIVVTNPSATISTNGTGTLTLTGGITKNNTALTLKGGGTINVNTVGISGTTSFTSDLIVDGLIANLNIANTYAGPTSIINGGTINANVVDALPTSMIRTTITFSGTGSSSLILGESQAIQSLTGISTSVVNLNTHALTIGTTAGTTTFAGTISGVGGSLIKDGLSTLILTKANTYSGGTSITGGILSTNIAGSLGSGPLSIDAAGTLQGTASFTLTNAVDLVAGSTIDITSLNVMTLSGAISGVGGSLTKTGTGILALTNLSPPNTYTGGTTISAGTVSTNINGGLGTGPISIATMATLQGTGTCTLSNDIALSMGTFLDVTGSNTMTLSGAITGVGGSFTKLGSGTLTLPNSLNTYNGGTSIAAGTVSTSVSGALGSGQVSIGGSGVLEGTANFTLSNNISLFPGSTIRVTGTNNMTLSGTVQGAGGSLTKTGTGILTLDNSSPPNTYTGGTTITAGTVSTNSSSGLGSGAISIGSAGTLQGTAIFTLSNGVGLAAGSIIDVTASNNMTLSGAISGVGGSLTKTGTGILTLANPSPPNTYTGGTTITGGTVSTAAAGELGSGSVAIGSAAILQGTATFTLSNAVSLAAGSTIDVTTANNMTLSGAVTGAGGSLKKTGAGILTLSNAGDNYSGGTIIEGGTLALLTGGALNAAGSVTLQNTSIFDISQATSGSTIGDISGASGTSVRLGSKTLTLGTASSSSYSGVIQDGGIGSGVAGKLVKQNGGTLSLLSANSYTGGTTITGGILSTNIAGAFGTGPISIGAAGTLQGTGTFTLSNAVVNVVAGSTVDVTASNNLTLSGVLTGAGGSLTKTSPGILTLTNSGNTYSGGTTITEGTVSINGAALGSGVISINALGTLQGTANLTLLNGMTLALGSVIDITASNTMTLNGALTGNSLTKTGTGTLVLANLANSYTGQTVINAGILQINAPGALPSASDVLNAGSLLFNYGGSGSYSGNMTGTGSLVIQGGFVELSGNNAYSGGTTVSTGTLQGNTSSLQGNITNNGAVIFDQATDGTYAGNMTGSGGSLTKENGGKLTFTGTNTYGGPTTIAAGNLAINGPLTSNLVTVLAGSVLSGTSSITGEVINHGTVSPGNSIGTLSVMGNYTQASGSTLLIEVNPETADRLAISGTATIEPNTTLAIFPSPGTYLSSNNFLVLSSSGLTGTFAFTPNNLPTIAFDVVYDANNVYLDISVTSFAAVACGGNIGRVAQYLDKISPAMGSDLAYVLDVLRSLDQPKLDQALAKLQPAPYKNFILAQEENVFSVGRGISDHLNGLINKRCEKEVVSEKPKQKLLRKKQGQTAPPEKQIPERRIELWTTVFGDWAKMDNRPSKYCEADVSLGYHARGGGALLGVDYSFADQFVIGMTGAYSYSGVDSEKSRVKGHINSYYGAFYALLRNHRLFLDMAFISGYDRFNATRRINFGTPISGVVDRIAKTKHGGWDLDAHIDGGIIIDEWKVLEIRPFFAFDGLWIHENGFQEKGAQSLNLRVRPTMNNLLRSETGVNFSRCICVNYTKWIPQARFSAVWETFTSKSALYRSNLVDQPSSFVAKNPNPNRTLFSPGVGLRGIFYDDLMSLSFDYNGEFGSSYQNQVAKAEFIWMF